MIAWALLVAAQLAPCHIRGALPDAACTPGDVATSSLDVVCHSSTRGRRDVNRETKRAVLAEYGVPWEERARFEVDHLISLELGGSNERRNLWPEPIEAARHKDQVEDRTHRAVCSGRMSLVAAQRAIAQDWTRMP